MMTSESNLASLSTTQPALIERLFLVRTGRYAEFTSDDERENEVWSWQQSLAFCRDDLNVRLLRLRHITPETLTWGEVATLLGGVSAQSLRNWVRGIALPSKPMFLMVDANLREIESYLLLVPLPQTNPWYTLNDLRHR